MSLPNEKKIRRVAAQLTPGSLLKSDFGTLQSQFSQLEFFTKTLSSSTFFELERSKWARCKGENIAQKTVDVEF